MVDKLQKLKKKKKNIDLETLIKNKYLLRLTENFRNQNNDSFIEAIEKNNMAKNIRQLEDFEIKMRRCQEKVNTQKRFLGQKKDLLQIE